MVPGITLNVPCETKVTKELGHENSQQKEALYGSEGMHVNPKYIYSYSPKWTLSTIKQICMANTLLWSPFSLFSKVAADDIALSQKYEIWYIICNLYMFSALP